MFLEDHSVATAKAAARLADTFESNRSLPGRSLNVSSQQTDTDRNHRGQTSEFRPKVEAGTDKRHLLQNQQRAKDSVPDSITAVSVVTCPKLSEPATSGKLTRPLNNASRLIQWAGNKCLYGTLL